MSEHGGGVVAGQQNPFTVPEAAAVLAERERCLAWCVSVLEHYGTGPLERLREAIRGGSAAPLPSSAGVRGSAVVVG